jgi:hypothetical protein
MAYAEIAPKYALGCPPCSINFGASGCVPCEPEYSGVPECKGCFDGGGEKENFFVKYEILPSVISGVIVAVATSVVLYQLQKRGLKTA